MPKYSEARTFLPADEQRWILVGSREAYLVLIESEPKLQTVVSTRFLHANQLQDCKTEDLLDNMTQVNFGRWRTSLNDRCTVRTQIVSGDFGQRLRQARSRSRSKIERRIASCAVGHG